MKLLNLKESIKVAAETQFLMKTQTFSNIFAMIKWLKITYTERYNYMKL